MAELREFRLTDYDRMAEIVQAIGETRGRTADWFRQRDASWNPSLARLRLVAEEHGVAVGWGDVFHTWWAFHPRKFNMRLNVHPSVQRRGIGSQLYARMLGHAESHWNPLRIGTETRETRPASITFLEHRGFVLEHRRWESRLDLADARLSRLTEAMARLRAGGLMVTTFADEQHASGRDAFLRELFDLEQRAYRDEPGYDPEGALQFDQFVANELDPRTTIDDGSFVVRDGARLVGVSRLQRDLVESARLHVGFTGVDPEYRGRGIAFALKLKTLEYARGARFSEILTQNDAANGAMLHINAEVGFQLQPAWLAYARDFPS